jgi:hypothetical protein
MPKSSDDPKPQEDRAEPSSSVEADQANSRPASQEEEEPTSEQSTMETQDAKSQDWWRAPQPAADWAQPGNAAPDTDAYPSKESGTADVYFCGHATFFSLNRALQAIAKEKLAGALRSFWDQEPIDVLAQNGEIMFVTTRDSDLYCPETPAVLANVDAEIVAKARSQQSETGTPFFLILARQESIARQAAMELMQHYGQKLFSKLWTTSRVWIMFEKNAELLSDVVDVSGEPNVDDWALETLRFIQYLDRQVNIDPTSIPAYTRDGFERVQKLKLTADEAQFASQFNGARSVQQIAKNLRLDLKSAHLTLFRFLALEIVECWPGSTATKPEQKSIFRRFRRSIRLGR